MIPDNVTLRFNEITTTPRLESIQLNNILVVDRYGALRLTERADSFSTGKRGAFPTRGLSFCPCDRAYQEEPYHKSFRGEVVGTFWVDFGDIFLRFSSEVDKMLI